MLQQNLNWYAIRISADALKVKCRKIGYNGPRNGRYIVPITRGKISLQMDCTAVGVDLYIPWESQRIVHHRSKKNIDRDFPLIPGYAFVHCTYSEIGTILNFDGVQEVMSSEAYGEPTPISDWTIHEIRMAEYAIFKDHREKYSPLTRKKLSKKFKKGDKVSVKSDMSIVADKVTAVTGRKTIKTHIQMFGTMVPAEIGIEAVV